MKKRISLLLVTCILLSMVIMATTFFGRMLQGQTQEVNLTNGSITVGKLVVKDYGIAEEKIRYHFTVLDPAVVAGRSSTYSGSINGIAFTGTSGVFTYAELGLSAGSSFLFHGQVTLTTAVPEPSLITGTLYVVSDSANQIAGTSPIIIPSSNDELNSAGYGDWIGTGLQNLAVKSTHGAKTIWSEFPFLGVNSKNENFMKGSVVEFSRSFSLPGTPTAIYLDVASDNGVEMLFNTGVAVYRSPNLDAKWRGSNLSESYVHSDGWDKTVTHYSIPIAGSGLVAGPNILFISGVNESKFADADQMSDTGNPAGFVYEMAIDYEYYVQGEEQAQTKTFPGEGSMKLQGILLTTGGSLLKKTHK